MPHIGQIIESIAAQKGYTQKQVGALINKHEKTVADIYKRDAIATDLLLVICKAFETDLFEVFYKEEPLTGFRRNEITRLNNRIQRLTERNQNLEERLNLAMMTIEAYKRASMMKEILERLVPPDVYSASMNELERSYKETTNPVQQGDQKHDDQVS